MSPNSNLYQRIAFLKARDIAFPTWYVLYPSEYCDWRNIRSRDDFTVLPELCNLRFLTQRANA
jgi:hypothetical protein